LIFTSLTFIAIFLPLTLIVYFLLSRYHTISNIFLLLISLVFYSWGDLRYFWVLISSIIINYFLASLMNRDKANENPKFANFILTCAIIFNLSLLIVFKYTNFIGDNLSWITHHFSDQLTFQTPSLLQHFPIGISFFTFSAITYIVDIYRKKVTFDRNPISTALFISFFPKLLMGPIVTYKDMVPQIRQRTITTEKIFLGMKCFIIGLGKKVLIANTLAITANQVFSFSTNQLTSASAWLGIICYTLQIYFDFSGYSDMAIGIARMTGFEFDENFSYPYFSKSIREFWQISCFLFMWAMAQSLLDICYMGSLAWDIYDS
jgi:alginate O-acetyltransferase complex protein AlgI